MVKIFQIIIFADSNTTLVSINLVGMDEADNLGQYSNTTLVSINPYIY